MNTWTITGSVEPTLEEAAAISAALVVVLQASSSRTADHQPISQWEESGKLVQQGLHPARTGVQPRWQTIERLRQRAAGGFYGIVGL